MENLIRQELEGWPKKEQAMVLFVMAFYEKILDFNPFFFRKFFKNKIECRLVAPIYAKGDY